jgi:integrase
MGSIIEHFLSNYESEGTKKVYRTVLKRFFKAVYMVEKVDLEVCAQRYFSEKRDYEEDIHAMFTWLNGKPPMTVRLTLSCVRTFLSENDVELSDKFWRSITRRIKGSDARTQDRIPSNKELKTLMMHLPIQGKSLFLTLLSSGMRIGETLKLETDDIYLNETPVRINILGKYTKSGDRRTAFISSEAKEALEEWLKLRQNYLTSSIEKTKNRNNGNGGHKTIDDKRIWPMEMNNAFAIWRCACEKAGLTQRDKETNRYEVHIHVLRKFFRTNVATAIPKDVVEALMGHEGYMTKEYRKYEDSELRKFYLQGEKTVIINAGIEEYEKKTSNLQNLVEEQNLKITRLENQLSSVQGAIQEIQEFQKGMQHFKKGGVVVTYHASTGFLPGALEETADEYLMKHKKDLEKEVEEIGKLLKRKEKLALGET